MKNIVKILDVKQVTHDVKYFRIEKPVDYHFTPGQATDVAINKAGMEEEKRPFTFTGLTDDACLEFTIKRYPDHHGVTDQLHQLVPGDELIIEDPWGAIEYKGPGYFIAGGAGITPFIAILRMLHKDNEIANNKLFFSNKTSADIIYEKELSAILNKEAVYILSRENNTGYLSGKIDREFIKQHVSDFSKHFYVCGPDSMVKEIVEILQTLGANADTVLFEK
ncbi:MAG: oxidoreductase FAD/NAD(P)-binding domain protein [Ferruginibacter sp.]|uniref:FAD-binding oxidoreductase n=1 Tax=Ferruginibacter sp. TaxID=1940288 RepID=UPI002657FDCF|nr:FAD-binding oxidoreductase [Ferruginibacter sp.]MDB5279649.1 oxidoreductase FAD/NAD(P)-binding domain protein [Ferruginibacter sp.]